ncbi:MAG: hypothetical protein AAGA70_06380 [Pseudomonadota bacterium]
MENPAAEKPKRRALLWLLAALGTVFLLLMVALLGLAWMIFGADPFDGAEFTPEAWAEAGRLSPEVQCARGPFVRSIERDVAVIGRPVAEVRGVLGAPDHERNWDGRSCDGYYLGFCDAFFGIDPDSLFVCVDEQGKVAEVLTLQH